MSIPLARRFAQSVARSFLSMICFQSKVEALSRNLPPLKSTFGVPGLCLGQVHHQETRLDPNLL